MPGMARWALAVLVVGMAGGLSEEDAGIELYLKQADTFISEPVSSKKACFVESSECRQSGSHWEPTRPVVMVFAPRGKERMVLGLLESCKRQDVVFRILAEDGAVVGFELEKLMRHKEISVETVHLNMSEPQEIMRSVERSFQQLLHYLPRRIFFMPWTSRCSLETSQSMEEPSLVCPLVLRPLGSEAAIAGGVCRAVRACLAGAREELKGLGGNGGGDVEQVMAQLWDKIGRERRKYQQHESDGTRDVAAREVEDRRRDRGSKCGKREDAVVVIPVVYSQPEMLRTQVITFRKHLLDELELFVVIDASDDSMRAQLEDVCKEMGVRYMVSPSRRKAEKHMASWIHGALLDWLWNDVVLEEFSTRLVMLTEQDVFLVKAISLRELVRNDRKLPDKKRGREVESQETFDVSAAGAGAGAGAGADGDGGESDVAPFIAGYLQERRGSAGLTYRYLHPCAMLLDLSRLLFPSSLSFSPMVIDEAELDTGGGFAPYFEVLKENYKEMGKNISDDVATWDFVRFLNSEKFAIECFRQFEEYFGLPDLLEGSILHIRKSSGWDLTIAEEGSPQATLVELKKAHHDRLKCIQQLAS